MKNKILLATITLIFIASCTLPTLVSAQNLYGMTSVGGANNVGVLFQYNALTNSYIDKYDFSSSSGNDPQGSLIKASDGNLYGLTSSGGANGDGVLFQFNPNTSTYAKKVDFAGTSNGATPHGSLMQASDGNLYGMTSLGGTGNKGVLFQFNPSSSTYTVKINFSGASGVTGPGANPNGALIQAADGNLYGMTSAGGVSNAGILFEYNPVTSTFTDRFDFTGGAPGVTGGGANPNGSLIQATDGNLYGMTSGGGVNSGGVLFQFNPSTSTYTKKLDFGKTDGSSPASQGSLPYGSLILASDGNLYGMTQKGGTSAFNGGEVFDPGWGVLFKYVTATSTYTVKYNFIACNGLPQGSLMQASDGNLYGMTNTGPSCGSAGPGTLFQFNPVTSSYTSEFNFNGANGEHPIYTSLIEVSSSPATSANLHLKMFIGGYYKGGGLMQPVLYNEGVDPNPSSTNVDTITVSIVDSAKVANDPYNPYNTVGQPPAYTGFWINDTVATAKGILQTNGLLSVTVSGVPTGGKYYLAINQRGMISTWSAHPISIYDGRFYDFTTSADSAYGNNEANNGDNSYSFYSGDWNQDENVDAEDFPAYDYEQSNFYYGYYSPDLNGDGNVDIYDYRVYNLNQTDFIYSHHP